MKHLKGMIVFDFSNDVIVVTGAAGNLGRAVVKEFLEQRGIVCALDHRHGRLDSLFANSTDKAHLHIYEDVDVTDRNAMEDLAGRIRTEVGPVSVLVNTVGGFTMGERVHEISPETWQRMMSVNVHSFLSISAAFVPGMLAKERGKVISITAKTASRGGAQTGSYAAAKGALVRLTESMAAELKSHNIQVNCVSPSTIDTPENREAMPNADFSKWVTPEQIAQVIVFLTSAQSSGVTGATVPVYGKS